MQLFRSVLFISRKMGVPSAAIIGNYRRGAREVVIQLFIILRKYVNVTPSYQKGGDKLSPPLAWACWTALVHFTLRGGRE